ncbi:hypothetical protein [Bradyrhizobium sp. SZCCHNR1045]|uniref:hypothetical protein n=1 Tax=Bradyrhizobium sp. SZCCHNR1045 TaxID=3057353 RepID=UPI002916CAB4|nr:hypothetical protein [Bradyrhizobium sp. SZCCHNR1045]
MSASAMFLAFSVIAIGSPMVWAIVQLFKEPPRYIRIAIPVLIAACSAIALYAGVLARGQQEKELAKLRPRSLSESQRAELKTRLPKSTPPIRIVYRMMDGEGKDYSDQLASAIKEAGGSVLSVAGNSLNDLHGKVTVAVNSGDQVAMNAADQLCNLLTAIQIVCGADIASGSLGGPPGQGEILLIIGRKD